MSLLIVLAALMGMPAACDMFQGNTPMVIYGKVVDQTGKPYSHVPVEFTASAVPKLQLPFLLEEPRRVEWQVTATTDDQGKFYLNAGRGMSLSPLHLGELPYRKGAIPSGFYYGRRVDGRVFHPDPKRPVVFMWWNDAYKRIVTRTVSDHPALGWADALEYLTGEMGAAPKGDLKTWKYSCIVHRRGLRLRSHGPSISVPCTAVLRSPMRNSRPKLRRTGMCRKPITR